MRRGLRRLRDLVSIGSLLFSLLLVVDDEDHRVERESDDPRPSITDEVYRVATHLPDLADEAFLFSRDDENCLVSSCEPLDQLSHATEIQGLRSCSSERGIERV